MLIEDLVKAINKMGAEEIRFKDIKKNYTTYFNAPNFELYKEEYQKTSPRSFYFSRTDDFLPKDCKFLFYLIPFREATSEEKKFETEHRKNCHYALKMLLLVGTLDRVNISYIYVDPPYYAEHEERMGIYNNLTKTQSKIIDIEKKINELGGKKIEFQDLIKNIDDYIYCREYEIYYKDATERLQAMAEVEFVYHFTKKPLRSDFSFIFYQIPLQDIWKENSYEFRQKHKKDYHGEYLEASGVKNIIVVIGTYNDEQVEYLMPIFPFDMLEEKQKEIKEFIFSNKQ